MLGNHDDDGDDDDDDDGNDGDNGGLPAYSHHNKIPPWWGNVSNDKGLNVSVSNFPPYMKNFNFNRCFLLFNSSLVPSLTETSSRALLRKYFSWVILGIMLLMIHPKKHIL